MLYGGTNQDRFLNSFTTALLTAFGLFLVLPAVADDPEQSVLHPKTNQSPLATANVPMSPADVYRSHCLACHDVDGRGNTVRKAMPDLPDFSNATWQKSRSDADLGRSIVEGKGKFMLPMKDKLGAADVQQMVTYMRGFQGGKQVADLKQSLAASTTPPAQTAAASGEETDKTRITSMVFGQYCLVCHAKDGRGTEIRVSMPALPDFTSGKWHEGQTNAQLAVSILDGKNAFMPSFRDRVTEAQVENLVAYIRGFGPATAKQAAKTEAPSDLDKQMRELQAQMEALKKQAKEKSPQ